MGYARAPGMISNAALVTRSVWLGLMITSIKGRQYQALWVRAGDILALELESDVRVRTQYSFRSQLLLS